MEYINYFEVLNALGDGVVCIDENKKTIYSNQMAMSILDVEINNFLLKDIKEVFDVSTALDGSIINEVVDFVLKSGKSSGFHQSSYIITKKDGVKFLSASLSRLIVDNHSPIVVISFRDITRLNQLEKQIKSQKENLQLILDSIPLGVMVIDDLMIVENYNTFIKDKLNLYEIESVNQLIGNLIKCENAVDSLCGLNKSCSKCQIRTQLTDNIFNVDRYETITKRITHKLDTETVEVDYKISFLSIIESGVTKTLVILDDVTSQLEYERNMSLAKTHAEEASHMKSSFIANMSHEIRTPLNGIIGMIDLTCREIENPELVENLEIAKKSSESLMSLINNILDLSKIEVGKMPINNKEFDVSTIFRDVISEYKFKAIEKKIKLSLDISSIVNVRAICDPGKIKQILVNLLFNALKFTDEGSVKVKGYLCNDSLIMKVIDTGIGIDEHFQDQIFTSFTQSDDTYTRKKGGTGLGLAISHELTKLLGGSINFTSEVGKGTSFKVVIPINRTETINIEDDDANKTANIKGQVLLVEDDIINQMVIRKQLEMTGYQITIANNGEEALSIFNQYHFDLVIMDIQMPVMNGLEAVSKLRENDKSTPVIALTALALKNEKEEIMSYGFDRYISKPVDLKVLGDIITNLIDDNYIEEVEIIEKIIDVNSLLKKLEDSLYNKDGKAIDSAIDALREYYEDDEINTALFKMKMALRKENYDQMNQYFNTISKLC